jgi:hypothetical protein
VDALAAVVVAGVVTAVALHSSALQSPALQSSAGPAAGAPTTISPAATASATVEPTAAADPGSPQASYVDRLCASGTLLSTLGATAITPSPGGDPAQLKRDYLAAADRTLGTVEAALPDLTVLRDEAPTLEIQVQFDLVVKEFTKARDAFTAGRRRVAAAQPLTADAYSAGVDSYLDGTRSLALAGTLVKGIKLPATYTTASSVAPHCTAT